MNIVSQRFIGLIAAVMISLLPVTLAVADVTELNLLGPDRDFPRVSRSYTSMNATFSRNSVKKSVAQIRSIAIGNTKNQLVGIIGQPVSAYSDGSWNYNLALPLPQGNRLVCQYRVYFDSDEKVAGTLWRRPQCVNIATGNDS